MLQIVTIVFSIVAKCPIVGLGGVCQPIRARLLCNKLDLHFSGANVFRVKTEVHTHDVYQKTLNLIWSDTNTNGGYKHKLISL